MNAASGSGAGAGSGSTSGAGADSTTGAGPTMGPAGSNTGLGSSVTGGPATVPGPGSSDTGNAAGLGSSTGSAPVSARFSLARLATAAASLVMLALAVLVVRTGVLGAADAMHTFTGYETLPAVLGMTSYLLIGTVVALTGLLAAWRLARRALASARAPEEAARVHHVPAAGAVLIGAFALLSAAMAAGQTVIDALDLSGSVALDAVALILEAYEATCTTCAIAAAATLVVLIAAGIATRSARRGAAASAR